jgi:hypothetical protein
VEIMANKLPTKWLWGFKKNQNPMRNKWRTNNEATTQCNKIRTANPKEQVQEEEQETEEPKPSPATQKPEEDTNRDSQEVLYDTQEPYQGTLGEGLNALLVTYSNEEEVATSIDPQEPLERPTQEQAPT